MQPPQDGAPAGPSPRRVATFLSVWALVAAVVLYGGRDVLLPFIFALVIAYVLTPVVATLEARARLPRWIAILATYAVTLGSAYVFGLVTAPRLVSEVASLRGEIPALVARARTEWMPRLEDRVSQLSGAPVALAPAPTASHEGPAPALRVVPRPDGSYDVHVAHGLTIRPAGEGAFHIEHDSARRPDRDLSPTARLISSVISYGRENALEVLRIGQTIVASVSRAIFVFFITLMLAGYLMLTRERVYGFARMLCTPMHRDSFDQLMKRIDAGLGGVVRGQLLICLVNGVLSAIGFWLFDLKYWPVLSVVAGAMSLIPIFGSILSSIPVVAIGLTQSFGTAVAVLAWIVGIHQIEANFLNPKIIGDAAKIHPVLVVLSLVIGEHLFKLPGALLAVPVLSIAQSLFVHFYGVVYGEAAE